MLEMSFCFFCIINVDKIKVKRKTAKRETIKTEYRSLKTEVRKKKRRKDGRTEKQKEGSTERQELSRQSSVTVVGQNIFFNILLSAFYYQKLLNN